MLGGISLDVIKFAAVAGGLAGGTTYLLDGANHNDAHNNLNLPLPFPDALQEFKVETSALPAQYGIIRLPPSMR